MLTAVMLVSNHTNRYFRASFLLVLAIQLGAVWVPSYNALTDFPIHITRAYILAHYDSSPLYQQLFVKSMAPLPNMAIDYLATPLIPFLGMIGAGKAFLSLLVILFDLGCHLLGRVAQGGNSWISLAGALLLFHGAYQYGFINYCFSISLLLLCLALWYRRRSHWTTPALAGLSILLAALFVSHVAGFACSGLIFALAWCRDLTARPRRVRRILQELAAFIPAGIILLSLPRDHGISLDRGGIVWSTLLEKLANCFTLFRSGDTAIDTMVLLSLIAVVLLAIRHRDLHNREVLYAGLFLFLVFLLAPRRFLMDGSGHDVRFAIPGLLLCLLSLRIPKSSFAMVVGLIFLGLLAVRLVYQTEFFRRASLVTEAVLRLADQVPSGTEFWMVCEDRRILRQNLHAGAYALVRSGAIPSNYIALPSQQPIWFRQSFQRADDLPERLTGELARSTLQRLPYALVCGFEDSRNNALGPYAFEVAASGPCALWKAR